MNVIASLFKQVPFKQEPGRTFICSKAQSLWVLFVPINHTRGKVVKYVEFPTTLDNKESYGGG